MKELLNLILSILFVDIIPIPLSFDNVVYISLFSFCLIFFIFFILSLIVSKFMK